MADEQTHDASTEDLEALERHRAEYQRREAEHAASAPKPIGPVDLGLELDSWAWVRCRAKLPDGSQCKQEALSLDPQTGRCPRCVAAHERERDLRRNLSRACIPEPMQWVRPNHPDLAKILHMPGQHGALGARLHALAENSALRTLTLLGNSGEGKTHLAIALMMPRLTDSLFADASTLTAVERQHRLGRGEDPLIERAFRARVLVIDELGEPASRERTELLQRLMQDRFAKGRRTIITSGLSADELQSVYGKGHARRMGLLPDNTLNVLGEARKWDLTRDRLVREVRQRGRKGEPAEAIAASTKLELAEVRRVLAALQAEQERNGAA